MSLPATEFWFSFDVRRNRMSFIFANLILLFIMALAIFGLWFFEVRIRSGRIIFFLFYVPFLIAQYMLSAQRLRDINLTGWLALLWFPIGLLPEQYNAAAAVTFLIVLSAVPGSIGHNRYGDDPLGDHQA